ncbi:hypothetical protein, partial [Escherichia coli]|uniref:hypothetical protein n=1 Tax=Escherichia coli TaxID=562 RepID=UPI0017D37E81
AAGYGIRAGTGSTITNNLGGIIRQAGTGGMYTISASDTLTLVNAGTISTASTALVTAAVDATQTLTLTNSGTITAAGGAA